MRSSGVSRNHCPGDGGCGQQIPVWSLYSFLYSLIMAVKKYSLVYRHSFCSIDLLVPLVLSKQLSTVTIKCRTCKYLFMWIVCIYRIGQMKNRGTYPYMYNCVNRRNAKLLITCQLHRIRLIFYCLDKYNIIVIEVLFTGFSNEKQKQRSLSQLGRLHLSKTCCVYYKFVNCIGKKLFL